MSRRQNCQHPMKRRWFRPADADRAAKGQSAREPRHSRSSRGDWQEVVRAPSQDHEQRQLDANFRRAPRGALECGAVSLSRCRDFRFDSSEIRNIAVRFVKEHPLFERRDGMKSGGIVDAQLCDNGIDGGDSLTVVLLSRDGFHQSAALAGCQIHVISFSLFEPRSAATAIKPWAVVARNRKRIAVEQKFC
ncbi:protein of unknown function (plasmid) [Caballeronia sp. S22]